MHVSTLVFYLGGIVLLLVMAYVLGSGGGQIRPGIARGFALIVTGIAAWLAWRLFALAF